MATSKPTLNLVSRSAASYPTAPSSSASSRKDVVDNYKSMFEYRISALAMKKLPDAKAPGKPETNTISSWSYDMEGHAKKYVERYCELANKTTEQLREVATPCLDDHHFK